VSRNAALAAVSAVLALLSAHRPGAMEIYLAPLAYQDESVSEGSALTADRHPAVDLLKRFDGSSPADGVVLKEAVELSEGCPRTYLEAARDCESLGYAYLLYGFVKRTEYSLYAELKLLERDGKEVAAAFISSDDTAHYDRLMDDLALKLTSYLRNDLGLVPAPTPRQPDRNLIVTPLGAGWWAPMGGAWSQAVAGLAAADLSVRFVPARPLFTLWARPCWLAFGLDLAYALGSNQPGVENFFLHAARVRLPVEAFMDLGGGHRIGLGAGPLIEVDTMAKSQLYGSTVVSSTVAPGASVSLIYHYVLTPAVTLGLVNTVDAALYSTPLLSWSPKIVIELWLGGEQSSGEAGR